jgi:hypothetical protein
MTARRARAIAGAMLAVAAVSMTGAATADDGPRLPAPALPRYAQECGACHLPYPPGLLPAASWQRLMAGLDRHFGSDASLDAASAREIGAWLQAHAGTWRKTQREGPPPDERITQAAWFRREHREVPAAVWTRPSVRSPSQCTACHRRADQGAFDEHDIRIPR